MRRCCSLGICVGFDETFDPENPASRPIVNPWDQLRTAIENAESWTSILPPNGLQVVSTARSQDAPELLVDPLGGVQLRASACCRSTRISPSSAKLCLQARHAMPFPE